MNADETVPTPNEPDVDDPEVEAPPEGLPQADRILRSALWVTAGELIVDLGYTYRAHFITGQKMRSDAKWLEVPRVIFPVIASAGTATFALFGLNGLAVGFGFFSALAIALERHFDPIGRANAHTDKADRLLSVYKDLRYFQNVKLRSPVSGPELESALAQLRKRADELRMLEPRQIPHYAYEGARRQVKDGQSEYVGDPLWRDPPDDL
jgi:hypothetical protein